MNEIQNELDEIHKLIEKARYEAVKHFEKKQAIAGQRLRGHLRTIKALADVARRKTWGTRVHKQLP